MFCELCIMCVLTKLLFLLKKQWVFPFCFLQNFPKTECMSHYQSRLQWLIEMHPILLPLRPPAGFLNKCWEAVSRVLESHESSEETVTAYPSRPPSQEHLGVFPWLECIVQPAAHLECNPVVCLNLFSLLSWLPASYRNSNWTIYNWLASEVNFS